MKPRKLNSQIWARLFEVADLRKKTPTYPELSLETARLCADGGLSALYCAQLVSAIMRGDITREHVESKLKNNLSEVA